MLPSFITHQIRIDNMTKQQRAILVTGGNAGIGLALCHQLAHEHGCRVFLGSRDVERGRTAVDSIGSQNVELVQIDVSSDTSVREAATYVKSRIGAEPLYAIVNNAGTGLAHRVSGDVILNTNLYGPKRVVEAFLPLLDPTEGRCVNVGSGAGPMWLRKQNRDVKQLLSDPNIEWDQIDVLAQASGGNNAYGLSKASLSAYSMLLAKAYPNILTTTISPGFIDTAIVRGYGARKPPTEGTVSIRHCLFADRSRIGNGYYYGSDGLRSPLTTTRDPGTPEFTGGEAFEREGHL